jgi:hypothetical protein
VTTGRKPRILVLADLPGWAWDRKAEAYRRYLGMGFDVTVAYHATTPALRTLPGCTSSDHGSQKKACLKNTKLSIPKAAQTLEERQDCDAKIVVVLLVRLVALETRRNGNEVGWPRRREKPPRWHMISRDVLLRPAVNTEAPDGGGGRPAHRRPITSRSRSPCQPRDSGCRNIPLGMAPQHTSDARASSLSSNGSFRAIRRTPDQHTMVYFGSGPDRTGRIFRDPRFSDGRWVTEASTENPADNVVPGVPFRLGDQIHSQLSRSRTSQDRGRVSA